MIGNKEVFTNDTLFNDFLNQGPHNHLPDGPGNKLQNFHTSRSADRDINLIKKIIHLANAFLNINN